MRRLILLLTVGQVDINELEHLEGEHDGDSEPETEHASDLRSHRIDAERRHVLQLDETELSGRTELSSGR